MEEKDFLPDDLSGRKRRPFWWWKKKRRRQSRRKKDMPVIAKA